MGIVQSIFLFLRAFILGRVAAAFENLALRQQVAVFKRSVKRPKLRTRDRIFWEGQSFSFPRSCARHEHIVEQISSDPFLPTRPYGSSHK